MLRVAALGALGALVCQLGLRLLGVEEPWRTIAFFAFVMVVVRIELRRRAAA